MLEHKWYGMFRQIIFILLKDVFKECVKSQLMFLAPLFHIASQTMFRAVSHECTKVLGSKKAERMF